MDQQVVVVRSDGNDLANDRFEIEFPASRFSLPADGLRRLLGCILDVLEGDECGPECEHHRTVASTSKGSPIISVYREPEDHEWVITLAGPRDRWSATIAVDQTTVDALVGTLQEVLR